jgi:hypothetical protein
LFLVLFLLQGYLLVLWDTPLGLLGCCYLLLLVALLLLPPEPTASQQQQQRLHTTTRQQQQQQQQQERQQQQQQQQHDAEAQQPLLSESSLQDEQQQQLSNTGARVNHSGSSSSLCWLLPVLLALLCAADLSAQYVLVVGAIVQDRPLLPSDVSEWIRTVVGIDDAASGSALLLALLRPALLLAGLAVYRWAVSTYDVYRFWRLDLPQVMCTVCYTLRQAILQAVLQYCGAVQFSPTYCLPACLPTRLPACILDTASALVACCCCSSSS